MLAGDPYWRLSGARCLLSWRVTRSIKWPTQLGSVAIYRPKVLSFDVGGRCVWVGERGGMVGSQVGSYNQKEECRAQGAQRCSDLGVENFSHERIW